MLSGWFSSSRVAPEASAAVTVAAPETLPPHVPDELLIFDTISSADQPFVDLFKAQTASFWSSDELKFSIDATDLNKLPPKARKLFEYILAFFATADGEVLENAVVNFLTESESLSIRMAYTAQVFFESIHIATYASAMAVYIPDSTRRTELTMAFKTDPLIKERDEWMTRHINSDNKANRLMAFVCAEGLFFMSAFMVIAWLRSRDLFPIFARANELISRDEWFHVKIGVARFRRLYGNQADSLRGDSASGPNSSLACGTSVSPDSGPNSGLACGLNLELIKEAVGLECRFARTLVPAAGDADHFDGLKAEDLVMHIQNLGNELARMLGFNEKLWDVDASKLPPWVTWIQVQPKASFYETAVTSYTTPIAVSEDPQRDLDF